MAVADVDILLKGLRVPEGGLNPAVAQEALHLLKGHTALEGQGGGSVPEDVRRHVDADGAAGKDLGDLILDRLHLQPVMRCPAADEQGRTVILPCIQVCPQGDLCFRIEERGTTFSTLAALDVDGMIRPVDVSEIECTELGHTAGGGVKEVDNRLFPECFTHTADRFELQGRHRKPLRAVNANRRDALDGVLADQVLLRAPLEETVQAQPDALQRAVFDVMDLTVLVEIDPDVVGSDVVHLFPDNREKLVQPEQVQGKRAF